MVGFVSFNLYYFLFIIEERTSAVTLEFRFGFQQPTFTVCNNSCRINVILCHQFFFNFIGSSLAKFNIIFRCPYIVGKTSDFNNEGWISFHFFGNQRYCFISGSIDI